MPRPTPNATGLLCRLGAAYGLALALWTLGSDVGIPAPPQDEGGPATSFYSTEPIPRPRTPSRLTFWKLHPSGLFERLAGDEFPVASTGPSNGSGELRFRYRCAVAGGRRHVATFPRTPNDSRPMRHYADLGLLEGHDVEAVVQAADPSGASRFFGFSYTRSMTVSDSSRIVTPISSVSLWRIGQHLRAGESVLGGLEGPLGEWNHVRVVSREDCIDVDVNGKGFRLHYSDTPGMSYSVTQEIVPGRAAFGID